MTPLALVAAAGRGGAALAVLLALAACGPKAPPLPASGMVPGGVPLTAEHTFSPGDEFEVRFAFTPEFNDRAAVGQDGVVSLKLIGEVVLGGLSVPEATARLKRRYATKLKSPELSVTIRRYAPEIVYVDGWVNRVGPIRSTIPLTMARAIAQAGGVKTGARTDEILLIRRDPDGNVQASQVALGGFGGAGRGDQDPALKSFDVVYVPRTAIAAISTFLRDYTKDIPFGVSFGVASPTVTNQLPGTVLGRPSVPQPAVPPP